MNQQNLTRIPAKLDKPENRRVMENIFSYSTLDLVSCVMVKWNDFLLQDPFFSFPKTIDPPNENELCHRTCGEMSAMSVPN